MFWIDGRLWEVVAYERWSRMEVCEFSENICSEDDLRSIIFGTFVVKFLACLPSPRLFEHLKNGIMAYF